MRIGTRESRLAMRQTEIFVEMLARKHPEVDAEIVPMKAFGDVDLVSPLDRMAGIGAFVRELDEAILKRRIDVSVNSLKDIPTGTAEGLCIPAVLRRDPPEDVVLPCPLDELPEGARIGTSSVRRIRLLKDARPDLETVQLRGNIHTRLSKLDSGEYDAIILARAGLYRMGIERPMHILPKDIFVPAPGQGAIAAECRSDDEDTVRILRSLDHMETRIAVTAERKVMRFMGAGCSAPVGINAEVSGNRLILNAVSFDYTPEPIRLKTEIPADYDEEALREIADLLMGRSRHT